MPVPAFLIIGAMKAGTTTLYRDLLTNPAVFMPHVKEPHSLCDDRVLTAAGRQEYARLFASAKADQVSGEASTGYTKYPDYTNVPQRARQICGPDLKVIYLIREPIARIVSHHYHGYISGNLGPDINKVVREDPRLLNYTRYAMQAQLWIDEFGSENVLVLKFEEYTAARRETVARICHLLGVEPRPELVDESAVFNRSSEKPVATKGWKRILRSQAYRKLISPYLSRRLKDRLLATLPKPPPKPVAMDAAARAFVLTELAGDLEATAKLMGRTNPLWPEAVLPQTAVGGATRD